ncbi:MAG: hypothetical protein AAFY98_08825 [Verrucomicrobiota bacterium]
MSGISSGAVTVKYDWHQEAGRIDGAQMAYDIRKEGMFSGHWTLEQDGHVVSDARKPSAMIRCFEVTGEGVEFTLRACSAMTRAYEIILNQEVVGTISPNHAFTRRATVECADAIPEHLQLFSFWLVGLTWRRSANSAAAS